MRENLIDKKEAQKEALKRNLKKNCSRGNFIVNKIQHKNRLI
jgi:hypothetical protein